MDTRAPTLGNPAPWGYFETVVWAVVAFGVGNLAGVAFCLWIFGFEQLRAMVDTGDDLNAKYNGVLIAHFVIMCNIVQIVIVAFAIRIRHWTIPDYLGLTLPPRHVIVQSLILLIVLLVVIDGVTLAFGHTSVPPFQVISFRTAKAAGALLPLFAAIVLFAPVAEEIMFRGFLYRGFVRKPGHELYAILIITVLWVAVHQQYDWVGLLQIFVIGLLLGWVRWSTGSIGLTMLMHMVANLFALIETIIWVEWLMD